MKSAIREAVSVEPPEPGSFDALQRVRFALDNLRVDNGHFVFEELCLAFSRARVSRRFMRATGPVAAGGDHGMDGETHWSDVIEPVDPGDVGKIVMACTTQRDRIASKIRADLRKQKVEERPLRVCFFSLSPVPVAQRHELEEWAKEQLDIALDVFDGPELADALLGDDLRQAAADRLGLPWLSRGPASAHTMRDSVRRAREFVSYQDRAPAFYPTTMRPTDLSSTMTITRVHPRVTGRPDVDETQLYSTDLLTRRGELALAVLRQERRGVVLGNPGTGKSTILLGLAASQATSSGHAPVLFARLREIGAGSSELGSIRNAIIAVAYGMDLSTTQAEAVADAMLHDADGLIVLDGLDEVIGSIEVQRVNDVIRLFADYSGRVVISSRIAGYRGVDLLVNEYAVDPLEPEQIDSFLDVWYAGRSAEGRQRIRRAMKDSAELRDLMSIPVMAGFAAYVAETDDVPGRTPELYEKYMSLFFQRVWKDLRHQREDFFEVGDLIDAAEELAWKMATMPSTIPEVIDRWIDVADLSTIHRLIPEHRDESRTLIQVDGMLTPHRGDGRMPLMQQEYRWIHRTMQEHLVGRRLASRLMADLDDAFVRLLNAAQRPRTWRVPLEHAFGLITDSVCDELLERFDLAINEGDPGGHIASSVLPLRLRVESRDSAPSFGERCIDLLQRGAAGSAESLISLMNLSAVDAIVSGAAAGTIELSVEDLGSLFDRLLADDWFSHNRNRVVELVAAMDPDRAVRMQALEWHAFPSAYGGGRSETSRRWNVSRSVLDWLFDEAAASHDVVGALPFVVMLVHLRGGNEVLRERIRTGPTFLIHAEVLAQQYLGTVYEDREGDPGAWEAMLTGKLGDTVAWLAGIAILPTQRARKYGRLAPWAETGVHLHELTAIDGPPPVVDAESVEHTRSTLDKTGEWIKTADEYEKSISAVHVAITRGSPSDLEGLVGVWMRLSQHDSPLMEVARPTPLFDQLAFAAGRGLDGRDWGSRWSAIQLKWEEDPEAIDLERGNAPLHSAIEDADDVGSAERVVLQWGLSTGIPVLTSMPNPTAPSQLLRFAIERGGSDYLALPSNLLRAIDWVEQEGSLPFWRPHLLPLLRQGAVSHHDPV